MHCCETPNAELVLGRRLRCRGTIERDNTLSASQTDLCLIADNGEKYLLVHNEISVALLEQVGEELEIVGIVFTDDLGNLLMTVQTYRTFSN